MPKISQASNNWPENPVVEASDYNDLYTDIENVSATIGDGNVRTEGVHTRNLVPNVICIEQASQYNGYLPRQTNDITNTSCNKLW